VSQNIEPIVIVNVTTDDGLTLAREFHAAGRQVIGVVAQIDKDFDKDISCLWQLLVGEVETLARAASTLNNFCEVIRC
jgi:ethanolamine utilization protein EutP (predicted NTPase)